MADGFAPYYFKNLLNGLTNKGGNSGSISIPSTVYIGLLTAMPSGFNSSGYFTGQTEVSTTDTGYHRVSLKTSGLDGFYFNTDAAIDTTTDVGKVSISNSAAIQFPVSTAAWSTSQNPIIGWALFDALTGGNCIAAGTLTTSLNVSGADQTAFFAVNGISLSIAPQASGSASANAE